MNGSGISSGILTGVTNLVHPGRRYLLGATVLTDGVNAATTTVYDNTTSSGKVLAKVSSAGPDRGAAIYFGDAGIRAKIGLYVTVEGTGASGLIYHK